MVKDYGRLINVIISGSAVGNCTSGDASGEMKMENTEKGVTVSKEPERLSLTRSAPRFCGGAS